MKTWIFILALTASVFITTGCSGTPVAVDRYGNMQPVIQVYQPPVSANTDVEFGSLALFGFNDFQARQIQMPFISFYNQANPYSLFDYLQGQNLWTLEMPYNQDGSLTLLRQNGFQIRLMPMMIAKP
jgi:hypothetical protein